ncbi:hypothetical protein E2562_029779 [Oryza meyeriana var. granulata]|uniref:Uncharacterized protein n=1 Tax=Oryza meyeriana var. granulata TaxID=110450 RepID=A0A6G1E6I4_9ORYZ|nr:hypothetical protein E2562_029779 [Oryza meyeriana var. granulata]
MARQHSGVAGAAADYGGIPASNAGDSEATSACGGAPTERWRPYGAAWETEISGGGSGHSRRGSTATGLLGGCWISLIWA